MRLFLTFFLSILCAGCSVFGNENVEIAPYEVIRANSLKNIEVRTYESLVLVSTPMTPSEKSKKPENSAFFKLFDYISGENAGSADIAMTAPVIMDAKESESGTKIPMTAPVFMDSDAETPMMSFVLPSSYNLKTAPKPTNPEVSLKELKNYTVATIRFNGRLTDKNVEKHKAILEEWIETEGYKVTGPYQRAGYNAPFTLPMFRRNEVLIPVKAPK